ncbi:MAG TPA: hypothetical protein VK658_24805 [Chryseolinea sp.]|nr:hypothetical protein [Chryseolinea sp.]
MGDHGDNFLAGYAGACLDALLPVYAGGCLDEIRGMEEIEAYSGACFGRYAGEITGARRQFFCK